MTNGNGQIDGIAGRIAAAIMGTAANRPRFTLFVLAVLCLISILGGLRLQIDADSSKMLSPDLPDQRRAAELSAAFPQLKQAIVIVVRSAQSDSADLVTARLVDALGQEAETIRDVYAPSADPFLATHGFLYRDVEEVDNAMTRLSASSNLLAKLRKDQSVPGFIAALDDARALAERAELGPESLDRLFDEAAATLRGHIDGAPHVFGWSSILADESEGSRATRLITITPKLDLTRLSPAKPALETIQSAIATLPTDLTTDVETGVTGEPALRAEEMQSVVGTIGISLGLSLLLVAAMLWIGLRSSARAALAFGTLVVTLVLTTGFAGFAIGSLNLISIAFIVLMVGLGIDFAIHILSHVAELERHGTRGPAAITLTGHRMGLALLLSAATTSLAFLAFGTTNFLGMAQLGIIGGVGVLIACAVSMTLIPAVLALRPAGQGPILPQPEARRIRLDPAIAPGILLVLACAAIWPASDVRFDADPMGLRNPDAPSVRAFNLLASDPDTTPYRASILVPDDTAAEDVAYSFANREGIGAVITLSDLVPDEQDEKLTLLDIAAPSIEHAIEGEPTDLRQRGQVIVTDPLSDFLAALREGPQSTGSAALESALSEYLALRTTARDQALQQDFFRSFPLLAARLDAMMSADYVERDLLPSAMVERFISTGGQQRVEIVPEDDLRNTAALAKFAETVRAIAPDAAGGPIQLEAAGRTVSEAMLHATLLAALATGLLAWLGTGRLLDAMAILGPLIVAGILIAAASVILDMPFNYANVIVLPLLIGIGVDSGIHIALREGRAPGAVFATSTPRAVIFSALTTMAAFGTLALSDHTGTASMGILLAIAMCVAVVSVMALTPTVIRWTRPRG
ncbi:MAG: MMPL family transporter [Pseudomonadota bacterium]